VHLSENSSPPWCLKLVTGLPSVSGPSLAVGPGTMYLLGPPLIVPKPVTQILSCELHLI